MNIEAYNKIIDIIEPVLSQKGMKAVDDESGAYFINDTQAVKVSFDDVKNLFVLSLCNVFEGKPEGTWNELSKWIFLPEYTLSDAESIGNDFSDTLNEKLGLKKSVTRTSDITINGDARSSMSLEGLLQRFLTIFPQYKDDYRTHVEKYGECLYITFFEATAVPCMLTLLEENDKKRLKKFFDLLNEMYTLADRNTASVVSGVFLASIKDEKLTETAKTYIDEYKYLKIAYENINSIKK